MACLSEIDESCVGQLNQDIYQIRGQGLGGDTQRSPAWATAASPGGGRRIRDAASCLVGKDKIADKQIRQKG